MIVIVEGIDRVGKTTLIERLKEEFNIPPFVDPYMEYNSLSHAGPLMVCSTFRQATHGNSVVNIERMNAALNMYEQFGDKSKSFTVDRFHMSEYVYGRIERDFTSMEAFGKIDSRLAKLGAMVVHVEPVDVDRSSREHGSNLSEHLREFKNLVNMTNCFAVTCNYNTLDAAIKAVVKRYVAEQIKREEYK